jgi:cell wall assembly regulator SMI1
MHFINVVEAEKEAKRFLLRCEEWKHRAKTEQTMYMTQTAEGGALTRASLDLSRSLAKLRKP